MKRFNTSGANSSCMLEINDSPFFLITEKAKIQKQ